MRLVQIKIIKINGGIVSMDDHVYVTDHYLQIPFDKFMASVTNDKQELINQNRDLTAKNARLENENKWLLMAISSLIKKEENKENKEEEIEII